MIVDFFKIKKKHSPLRKLSFLPRFGIYIDAFGYEISYKHIPLLETLLNLIEAQTTRMDAPLAMKDLKKILEKQFSEITFPKKGGGAVVDTTAQTISVKRPKS